jgi:hypothetical protein
MAHYNFAKDLQDGESAQDAVLKLLHKTYPKAHQIPGYFKEYDIHIPEIGKTIEVKYDIAVNRTGNYFLETEFNKKDEYGDIVPVECGVAYTQADYWCEMDDEYMIFIEMSALKYFLRDYRIVTLPPKLSSLGGKGYLIKKEKLLYCPYAIVIDRSNPDETISL